MRPLQRLLSAILVASLQTACLDSRPPLLIPGEGSEAEGQLIDLRLSTWGDRLDLLLVIDNSPGMRSKQQLLADAAPGLLQRLLAPRCENPDDPTDVQHVGTRDPCPLGYWRRISPFASVHVGVITTSLGGYGDPWHCVYDPQRPETEQKEDRAHLLGSLPRGRAVAPSATPHGFFAWDESTELEVAGKELSDLILAAGEQGCGYEAPLEAWLRFLVDPAPHTGVNLAPCAVNPDATCATPELDEAGALVVDHELLQQRAAFLRPTSAVAILMLSDENDCSFDPFGNAWAVSNWTHVSGAPRYAPRATAACQDGANDACCAPCASANVNTGCPTELNAKGDRVAQGCGEGMWHDDPLEDPPELRCFDQKRRFGMNALFPIERYVNALSADSICPERNDLDALGCPAEPVPNPLLAAPVEPAPGDSTSRRPSEFVSLVGIVGAPWQDLSAELEGPVRYYVDAWQEPGAAKERWSLLIPSADGGAPIDPLMREQVAPRSGKHPLTGEPLAPPDAGVLANSINGHEHQLPLQNKLQYACINPLPEPMACPASVTGGAEGQVENIGDAGASAPSCECALGEEPGQRDPVCQAADSSYGRVQHWAGAHPGTRQLQVLSRLPERALPASICPRDLAGPDRGFAPVLRALSEHYSRYDRNDLMRPSCLSRALPRDASGGASCALLELVPEAYGRNVAATCEALPGRKAPPEERLRVARDKLREKQRCEGLECESTVLCEIEQLVPEDGAEYTACTQERYWSGPGWCGVFEETSDRSLLEHCANSIGTGVRFPTASSGAQVLMCATPSGDDQ
jgi:hypothetical protein